ncbi:MAG TPA: hypothetical protein VIH35_01765, partial [Kiritimatiellia bacterium]
MRLGEILVEAGRITRAQLSQALERQKSEAPARRLGEILVASEQITEEALVEALARQFAMPFVAAAADDMLDPELVAEVPVDWARAN